MSGAEVVASPPAKHVCTPGWDLRWSDASNGVAPLPAGFYWHDRNLSPGTIVRCECDTTWVAEGHPDDYRFGLVWRREGRFARWRRERRASKGGA
jgi:hypothetical protein